MNNYTQLTEKKKIDIDILLKQGYLIKETAKILDIKSDLLFQETNNTHKKLPSRVIIFLLNIYLIMS